jgi:hypothetical protein
MPLSLSQLTLVGLGRNESTKPPCLVGNGVVGKKAGQSQMCFTVINTLLWFLGSELVSGWDRATWARGNVAHTKTPRATHSRVMAGKSLFNVASGGGWSGWPVSIRACRRFAGNGVGYSTRTVLF